MLPLKWKIFRIINFLFILLMLGLIGRRIWTSIHEHSFWQGPYVAYLLILFALLLLAINCGINLVFVEKYNTDYYSRPLKIVSLVLLIFFGIMIAFFIVLFFNFLFEYLNKNYRLSEANNSDLLAIITLFITISLGVYIFWMQIVLRKTFRRNFENTMDNFLKN